MLEFDNIDAWAPKLTSVLDDIAPVSVRSDLAKSKLRYVEDARDFLFTASGQEPVVDRTLSWLRASTIVGYHGTRLTDPEVESVRTHGLLPLNSVSRRERLLRALSKHSEWPAVADQLDAAIRAHGAGQKYGGREGQVHLTLSQKGLLKNFNHYIAYGSEFDQNVADELLGDDGKDLLAQDGARTLISMAVPGEEALEAAHPFFSVQHTRQRGGVPNIVREFITAWAYRLADPISSRGVYSVDCGMIFKAAISPDWLVNIEALQPP